MNTFDNYNLSKQRVVNCDGEEININNSMNRKNTKRQNRKVIQMNMDGDILGMFDTGLDAQSATGIDRRNISKACHGIIKHTGGFMWEFLDKYRR